MAASLFFLADCVGLYGTPAAARTDHTSPCISQTSSSELLANLLFAKDPMSPARWFKTLVFVPYKLATTAVSVCLPLPAGVFKPTFVAGAAIGRAVGETLHALCATAFPADADDVARFLAWEYAVIGAAAFAAGVTRALSTAVIFLELAGENHLRGPLAFATLLAHFIGNRCGPSLYDALIDTSGTPSLPEIPARTYYLPVRRVARPVAPVSAFFVEETKAPGGAGRAAAAAPDRDRATTYERFRAALARAASPTPPAKAAYGAVARRDADADTDADDAPVPFLTVSARCI